MLEPCSRPGGVARVVHRHQRAGRRVVAQLLVEPLVLGAAVHLVAVGVEHVDAPATDLEDVVAALLDRVEVAVVARGAGGHVLVVARDRLGDRLQCAPRLVVGVAEAVEASLLVLQVTEGEHPGGVQRRGVRRRRGLPAGRGRRLRAGRAGDVAHGHQRRRGHGRRATADPTARVEVRLGLEQDLLLAGQVGSRRTGGRGGRRQQADHQDAGDQGARSAEDDTSGDHGRHAPTLVVTLRGRARTRRAG